MVRLQLEGMKLGHTGFDAVKKNKNKKKKKRDPDHPKFDSEEEYGSEVVSDDD